MGCDIHLFVEVKKDGEWVHHPVREKYLGPPDKDGHRNMDYDKYFEDPLYVGRNYDLFAILADVRNDGFNIISPSKGLPEDVSKGVFDEYTLRIVPDREYDGDREDNTCRASSARAWIAGGHSIVMSKGVISHPDWHSASYHTVAELDAFDWDQVVEHQGTVDLAQFKVYLEKGHPECWSGGVWGGDVISVSEQEMKDLVESGKDKIDGKEPYTTVRWKKPYRWSTGYFLDKTMPALRELGKPDEVRIVFFFDN